MSNETLDLSNVVSITIQNAIAGLALPRINTAALFTSEEPSWQDDQPFKIYTNPSDVITDFGSATRCAAIAQAFFAQQPNPLGTSGYLVIITLGDAETIPTAIARTINSVYYFGVLLDKILANDVLATLATYMQSIDKLLFYASATAADYAPGGPLDLIRQAGETHVRCLFYSVGSVPWVFSGAYAGRALSTDFAGVNTTQTMHLKTLAGIVIDPTIDQTELIAAGDAGVDVYPSIAGVPSLFTSGKNVFYDEVYNEFWFKFSLQTEVFNFLRSTGTKVPQTEVGMEALKNVCRQVCAQAVRNGFAGPGAWNSSTVFGNPQNLIRNILDIGFYVFSQPIILQSQTDREDRIAPTIQIALKTQGAIQKVNVIVSINL